MILLPVLLMSGSILNAADSTVHPIDARMNACLAKAHATMPRATCYNTAYLAWETDIKNLSNKLLKNADTLQRKKLIDEQNTWEKERDLEFNKIADKYNAMRGTGYIPIRIKLRMEILRKRALQLEKQLPQ